MAVEGGMGQRLLVAGWLRFKTKAQLTKGLAGFREREAPGFYEAAQWQVAGLDAWVRIDAHLPGDFTDVEAPFLAILRASAAGYIDYFEEDNRRNQRQAPNLVKRWNRRAFDKLLKKGMPDAALVLGSSSYGFATKTADALVRGALAFDEAALATAARAPMPLPYVGRDGIYEVRLGGEGAGSKVTFAMAVRGPVEKGGCVLEEPVVEWSRTLTPRARGSLTIEAQRAGQRVVHTIEGDEDRETFPPETRKASDAARLRSIVATATSGPVSEEPAEGTSARSR